jgi:HlyD family secretion protein
MQVNTSVAESDIGRLSAGMAATFTVDAYPGTEFAGRIREIRNAANVVQNVVTYDAVIDVENPELKLKPGMTASVSVVTDRRDNVLRVPTAALRFQPPSSDRGGRQISGDRNAPGREPGRGSGANNSSPMRPGNRADGARGGPDRAVWVLRDQKPVRVPVGTGLADGTFTEITNGDLQAGAAVITAITGGGGQPAQRMQGPRIL